MNRRHFLSTSILGGIALMAPAVRSTAAQFSANDREFVSPTSNAAIVLGPSDFTFYPDSSKVDPPLELPSGTVELVTIIGTVIVYVGFVSGVTDPKALQNDFIEYRFGASKVFDILGEADVDGGSYFAAHEISASGKYENGVYFEYQVGAFENADLLVLLTARPDSFLDGFYDCQQRITIGDAEPFLFVDDSEVTEIQFPSTLAAVTPTAQTQGRRTTSPTPAPTQVVQDTASVDTILAHRQEFMADFTVWAQGLGTMGDANASQADKDAAVDTMIAAASDWPGYSARARGLTLPADQSSLQAAYYAWGDAISELGNAWNAMLNQTGSADALFAALEKVLAADEELAAQLGA